MESGCKQCAVTSSGDLTEGKEHVVVMATYAIAGAPSDTYDTGRSVEKGRGEEKRARAN